MQAILVHFPMQTSTPSRYLLKVCAALVCAGSPMPRSGGQLQSASEKPRAAQSPRAPRLQAPRRDCLVPFCQAGLRLPPNIKLASKPQLLLEDWNKF